MSAHLLRLRRHVRLFVIVGVLAAVAGSAAGCGGDNPLKPSDYGIQVTDLVTGSGTQARQGRGLTVHYTLWLFDDTKPEGKGTQVQTTVGGAPFSFALGYGQVIAGWDIGLDGMKVGGTRRLVIPPEVAYGAAGSGQIPGNATLVYDIQLIGVF